MTDPLGAAARADAAAAFDELCPAWFQPSEREEFIERSWRGSVPRIRAAIRAYLLARADQEVGGQITSRSQDFAHRLRLLAAELEEKP